MRSDFANAAESHLLGSALIGALVGFPSGDAVLGLITGSVVAMGGYIADNFFPASKPLETKKDKVQHNQSIPSYG